MTFLQLYTKEIIYRISYLCFSAIITFISLYYFTDELFHILTLPLHKSLSIEPHFIYTHISEALLTSLQNCLTTTIMLTVPVGFIQLFYFLIPGIYHYEKVQIKKLSTLYIVFFVFGLWISYSILCPMLWHFLLNFGMATWIDIRLEAKMEEYFSFCIHVIFALTGIFQVIPILMTSIKINIITLHTLVRQRKAAILISFLLGALITPPDVVSQSMIGTLLYISFEITILLVQIEKKYQYVRNS